MRDKSSDNFVVKNAAEVLSFVAKHLSTRIVITSSFFDLIETAL
jgi:hypothetical protein